MIQQVWNLDSLALPASYVDQFHVMIADAPYRPWVHEKATSQSVSRGTRHRDLGFDPISDTMRNTIGAWTAHVQRWSIVYSDVETSHLLQEAGERAGTEYIRTMPWVRWSMPNLQGNRPAQGFEHLLVFHPPGKKRWNGPGSLVAFTDEPGADDTIVFMEKALRGASKHKTEKPLDQALNLVSYFTDVGESVFDPFSGHGTIGLACRLLGRHYSGFEIDAGWASRAQARLVQPFTPRDMERVIRWLEQDSEPVSALSEGPSVRRAQSRAQDKENVRTGVFL